MGVLGVASKICFALIVIQLSAQQTNAAIPSKTRIAINKANQKGPYVGIVIPNLFELNPLLKHSDYKARSLNIDVSGRRFRFGAIAGQKVILVVSGLGMANAAITTQLLLTIFNVEGLLHYGIAGNANPSLNIGDVVIPQSWSHTALWNWQRYGQGREDELPLEANGDYTREIGYIKFADYTVNVSHSSSYDNLFNNIWYQPEEVFPVDGTPEERQHIFWIPVDPLYYNLSQNLEGLKLEDCVNSTTCLTTTPKVVRVERGTSASIYLDNAAYRGFLYEKFNVSPVEMESAAVALISYQQKIPFIVIRALSDLAGGGSADSNEADTFINLAANNSVAVAVEFVKQFSTATLAAY
ncbi:bark storage protein A [Ziziphus jujuba]|uniref:Bark storage protein A n=1 Tax=Ziziphus jujuba TaxID=326968 RepID=A0ABM3IN81_ZIZJJ|nr:bark storage protein A [Ziziphus jujuba]